MSAEPTAAPGRRPRWWLRVLPLAAAGLAVAVALHGRIPEPAAVVGAARDADKRWGGLAVLAQVASQAMFADQQRRLLSAFSVTISKLRAVAITYSRTAISMALPAGSAAAAAFAFRQYRRRGASRATAATVTILSGLASTAGLLLLYLAGLLTAGALALPGTRHPVVLGGTAVLAATAAALVTRSVTRSARTRRDGPPRHAARRTAGRFPAVNRVQAQITDSIRGIRAVPARDWAATLGFAATSWLFDLACLAAVAHACHLTLGYAQLAGSYLAAQIARQLPLTPGGIGLIETSLLAGLVSAGAPRAGAAAVVLGYRLISCWLILPVGLGTGLGLRRGTRERGPASGVRPATAGADRRPSRPRPPEGAQSGQPGQAGRAAEAAPSPGRSAAHPVDAGGIDQPRGICGTRATRRPGDPRRRRALRAVAAVPAAGVIPARRCAPRRAWHPGRHRR